MSTVNNVINCTSAPHRCAQIEHLLLRGKLSRPYRKCKFPRTCGSDEHIVDFVAVVEF